jgi:ubiquinone/menaquinone biosynthesis C-methylase UbiE
MKTRESGMPSEEVWDGFFKPEETLKKLGLATDCTGVVDFGCGYSTFTIPAAHIVRSIVYALDIEAEMVEATKAKAEATNLTNVIVRLRDFIAEGSGLLDGCVEYAMLFNILHAEETSVLLREAWRVLVPGGRLGIMHWNYDPNTPRGPNMSIRPRPEQCRDWAEQVGFQLLPPGLIDLPPYHYGFVFERPK